MQYRLTVFRPEYSNDSDVLLLVETDGSHMTLISPDDIPASKAKKRIVRADAVDILPFTLYATSPTEGYRVDGSGFDDNPDAELHLVNPDQISSRYDIVRRYKGRDTLLTDGALSLGDACNVLAVCNAIDWQCLDSNTGDIETVCVSNAVALLEIYDEEQGGLSNTIS
jgi:hypothetical protein